MSVGQLSAPSDRNEVIIREESKSNRSYLQRPLLASYLIS